MRNSTFGAARGVVALLASLALALVGLVMWRGPKRLVADAWLAAMLAFIFGAGWGHMGHDYYQLPLVPILALYIGRVAAPLFDRAWLRLHVGGSWRTVAGVALVVTVIAAHLACA